MQHRARPSAAPRPFHSHRASARPIGSALLGERVRSAVLAGALAAGVGVAGLSTVAADAQTTTRVAAAAHTGLEPARPYADPPADVAVPAPAGALPAPAAGVTAAERAPGTPSITAALPAPAAGVTAAERAPGTASITAAEAEKEANRVTTGGPALAFAPLRRKVRPVPAAKWVNPMPGAVVTSCFGPRWGRLHAGVDLAAPEGTPIRAAGAGTVVAAGAAEGYGIAVLIDHGNGYLTHYAHMSAVTVTVGRPVKTGEEIGREGSTGHSTGPHLHFEVHEGTYKNPIEPTGWMHDHGVDIPGCDTVTDSEEAAHGD
ncbi:MAG TPA: peptidoglycan DD-metalloendopeptidase family protein [Actinoplanes sp.]|nr:peptidoglycan DD-metalloendopeptidase family protein [Actinoplanes sp.]